MPISRNIYSKSKLDHVISLFKTPSWNVLSRPQTFSQLTLQLSDHMALPQPASFLSFIFYTVSWEIKVNDFDEKDVNKFQSNGYQCPTCFAVMGRKCNADLKWCRADKLQCVEFSGIINTGTFLGTFPSGEGNGTPLQHSCLENPMDRGAW